MLVRNSFTEFVHILILRINTACSWDPLTCNLDNLLIQLGTEVIPKWYDLGLVIGIAKEILDEYSTHPARECLVDVLDYWIRNSCDVLTWRDVAETLKEIRLHELAERAYQIGTFLFHYSYSMQCILQHLQGRCIQK